MQNESDIRMLREDPEKLLLKYQPVIRIIVKSLAYKGYLPKREISDLVQDVNRKLVERMPRIRNQYNYKSRFKTYFSVVVRNLCLEEFRKLRILAEPAADLYEQPGNDSPADAVIISQEYERLKRAIRLFYRDEPALWVTFRVLADIDILPEDIARFGKPDIAGREQELAGRLNHAFKQNKRIKLEIVSEVLSELDTKIRSKEAIRKWFENRLDEILTLMNGKPPRSAYTLEILLILIEKAESEKNNA